MESKPKPKEPFNNVLNDMLNDLMHEKTVLSEALADMSETLMKVHDRIECLKALARDTRV